MGLVLKLVPFFSLIVLFIFFSDSIEQYINSETDDSFFFGSKEKFIVSVFWTALIAPIYEEIIFDGAFLKNKIYKWISYIGLFGFTLYFNRSVYSLALLLLFYIFTYLNNARENNSYTIHMIITNALLFSVIHVNFYDLNVFTPISLASRFGGHLLALWLVVNYKLIYAIFLHIFWNTFLMIIALYFDNPLNSVEETELLYYENEYINVEYNEAPNFQDEKYDFKNDSTWYLQSAKVESLLKIKFINSDSILNLYKANSGRYDFNIRFKEGLNNNQILKFLIQDSLLIEK